MVLHLLPYKLLLNLFGASSLSWISSLFNSPDQFVIYQRSVELTCRWRATAFQVRKPQRRFESLFLSVKILKTVPQRFGILQTSNKVALFVVRSSRVSDKMSSSRSNAATSECLIVNEVNPVANNTSISLSPWHHKIPHLIEEHIHLLKCFLFADIGLLVGKCLHWWKPRVCRQLLVKLGHVKRKLKESTLLSWILSDISVSSYQNIT